MWLDWIVTSGEKYPNDAQVFGPYNASMIDHNIMRLQLARMPKGSFINP